MMYADRIQDINSDAAAAKYELFWTVANEFYGLMDTVLGFLQGVM